jgi:hypothetical protein
MVKSSAASPVHPTDPTALWQIIPPRNLSARPGFTLADTAHARIPTPTTANTMKTKLLILLTMATGGSLLAIPEGPGGRPERPGGPGPDRERRGPPPEVIERFDSDGDGKLSQEERREAMKARREMRGQIRQRMLEKFDANGDGKLDEEERNTAKEARKAKHEEILSKYDADKDGRLSREERQAAIEAGEPIPPRRRPGARRGGPGQGEGNGAGNRRGKQSRRGR